MSFPGVYYDVERWLNTVVRGFTDRGDPVQALVGTEVLARCLQYKTGHLDSVLFIDRDGRRDKEPGYEGNQSIKAGMCR